MKNSRTFRSGCTVFISMQEIYMQAWLKYNGKIYFAFQMIHHFSFERTFGANYLFFFCLFELAVAVSCVSEIVTFRFVVTNKFPFKQRFSHFLTSWRTKIFPNQPWILVGKQIVGFVPLDVSDSVKCINRKLSQRLEVYNLLENLTSYAVLKPVENFG